MRCLWLYFPLRSFFISLLLSVTVDGPVSSRALPLTKLSLHFLAMPLSPEWKQTNGWHSLTWSCKKPTWRWETPAQVLLFLYDQPFTECLRTSWLSITLPDLPARVASFSHSDRGCWRRSHGWVDWCRNTLRSSELVLKLEFSSHIPWVTSSGMEANRSPLSFLIQQPEIWGNYICVSSIFSVFKDRNFFQLA